MHRLTAGVVALGLLAATGCAISFSKRSPWDMQQLEELSSQLDQFKTLARLKAEEADELRRAKDMLSQRLGSSGVSVGYDERGVVARMPDTVLFDSGKAALRFTARGVLKKVAQVLTEFPNQPIGIEGHTDDVPISRSGWADNTELSYARARSVVDYLVEKRGLDSSRLVAIGYGETRPIASNDTPEGRQKNRRVEIIILPRSSGAMYGDEAARATRSLLRYTK